MDDEEKRKRDEEREDMIGISRERRGRSKEENEGRALLSFFVLEHAQILKPFYFDKYTYSNMYI